MLDVKKFEELQKGHQARVEMMNEAADNDDSMLLSMIGMHLLVEQEMIASLMETAVQSKTGELFNSSRGLDEDFLN